MIKFWAEVLEDRPAKNSIVRQRSEVINQMSVRTKAYVNRFCSDSDEYHILQLRHL